MGCEGEAKPTAMSRSDCSVECPRARLTSIVRDLGHHPMETRRAEALGHPNLNLATEGSGRGLDLIQARGVAQVEQSIHLGHMPAQTAGQLGLADALLGHGLVDAQLGALQGWGAHGGATRGGRRNRQGFAGIDVERQGGLQGIDRIEQRFVGVFALRDRLGNVGKGDDLAAFRLRLKHHWVIEHGSGPLQSKFLDGLDCSGLQLGRVHRPHRRRPLFR